MKYTLDTNIVIHAFDRDDVLRNGTAARILDHALNSHGIMTRQVLGELLAVAHRKPHVSLESARRVIAAIEATMELIDTNADSTIAASHLAERYRLQYFDALICTVAQQNGVSILFSEDMQDSLHLASLTIVNPYLEANEGLVRQALS